jgi:hypothetical protein
MYSIISYLKLFRILRNCLLRNRFRAQSIEFHGTLGLFDVIDDDDAIKNKLLFEFPHGNSDSGTRRGQS